MGAVSNVAVPFFTGALVDSLLGTRIGKWAGLAYGLFKLNPGDMTSVYDRARGILGDQTKDFGGFNMWEALFGDPKGKDVKPNRERAEANAKDLEQKTGFPWGKALLYGGAGLLGLNILDRVTTGPYSMPWFSPFMYMAGGVPGAGYNPGLGPGSSYMGPLGGGILSLLPAAFLAFMGIKAMRAIA
jgi:hypothetical protein